MAGERTLPGMGLTAYWDLGSDGWKPGMDANFLKLSTLANISVKSRTDALPGTPAAGDIYIVPEADATNGDKIAVWDSAAWTYYAPAVGWVAYAQDEAATFVYTDDGWLKIIIQVPFQIGLFCVEAPEDDEVILGWCFAHAAVFAGNMAGSIGAVETNPTVNFCALVKKNGTNVGLINIGTNGVVSFTTTGGAAVSFAAGDVLKVVAPASADTTIAGITVTLVGTRG